MIFWSKLVALMAQVTIEPVIVLFTVAVVIVDRFQVNTNLLIWKICVFELSHSEDVCRHLQDHEDVNSQVQVVVNNFMMTSQWVGSAFMIVITLFAGVLSDLVGTKPLMVSSLIGYILKIVSNIIMFDFVESLPIQFFYLDNVFQAFGGLAVYYLGVYGFGAAISQPDKRAQMLTRLDGFEALASILGNAVASFIFRSWGYTGSYATSGILCLLALNYVCFILKEPTRPEANKEGQKIAAAKLMKQFYLDILAFVRKDRSRTLKLLIFLQVLVSGLYMMIYEVDNIQYLYMLRVFQGFDDAQFAWFILTMNVLSTIHLMVTMPLVSGKLGLHDSLILTIFVAMEAISFLSSAFVPHLWQFYLTRSLGAVGYCKPGLLRSLLSKCVEAREVGKAYAILSLVSSISPMASTAFFKQLYSRTIDTFPGAFLLLASAILGLTFLVNVSFYFLRSRFKTSTTMSPEN